MKEQIIVYALGDYWKNDYEKIREKYDILACCDQNPKAEVLAGEYRFITPEQIAELPCDKIILACKRRGIREFLVVQYHIPVHKIFYFEEVFGNSGYRTISCPKNYSFALTIVIPTYNRKERLRRTLDVLENQTCDNFNIIILDNNSDYNVNDVIQNREKKFQNRIKLVHNKRNIGMLGNLASAFVQETEGWLWTLSDDDIPSLYAVEDICDEIEKAGEIGAIHFSIQDLYAYVQDGKEFSSLPEFLSFYKHVMEAAPRIEYGGDFIFFSNKVYNLKYVKDYCDKIYFYIYSGVPNVIPILFMLNDKKARVRISDKKIVQYDMPNGDHWDWYSTVMGMRIISDFPFDLDKESWKTLYRVIIPTYWSFLYWISNERKLDDEILEKIYDEVYSKFLTDNEKADYQLQLDKIRSKP
jgi:glycosyltransferase involved in cell wall biosynthesis